MCNKAADSYAHSLGSIPNCYKAQKICDKAASTYPSTIQFIQEMFDKAFETCPFLLDSVPDQYIT